MTRAERMAFETAKDIVIAKMSQTTLPVSEDAGKVVGEFFEAIYQKILPTTTSFTQDD